MPGNWSTADGHTAVVYPLGSWYTPCIYHDRGVCSPSTQIRPYQTLSSNNGCMRNSCLPKSRLIMFPGFAVHDADSTAAGAGDSAAPAQRLV